MNEAYLINAVWFSSGAFAMTIVSQWLHRTLRREADLLIIEARELGVVNDGLRNRIAALTQPRTATGKFAAKAQSHRERVMSVVATLNDEMGRGK